MLPFFTGYLYEWHKDSIKKDITVGYIENILLFLQEIYLFKYSLI